MPDNAQDLIDDRGAVNQAIAVPEGMVQVCVPLTERTKKHLIDSNKRSHLRDAIFDDQELRKQLTKARKHTRADHIWVLCGDAEVVTGEQREQIVRALAKSLAAQGERGTYRGFTPLRISGVKHASYLLISDDMVRRDIQYFVKPLTFELSGKSCRTWTDKELLQLLILAAEPKEVSSFCRTLSRVHKKPVPEQGDRGLDDWFRDFIEYQFSRLKRDSRSTELDKRAIPGARSSRKGSRKDVPYDDLDTAFDNAALLAEPTAADIAAILQAAKKGDLIEAAASLPGRHLSMAAEVLRLEAVYRRFEKELPGLMLSGCTRAGAKSRLNAWIGSDSLRESFSEVSHQDKDRLALSMRCLAKELRSHYVLAEALKEPEAPKIHVCGEKAPKGKRWFRAEWNDGNSAKRSLGLPDVRLVLD